MNMDFNTYIRQAQKAEDRSTGLWLAVNQAIRSTLETQQKRGKTLDEVADMLIEIAGRKKKRGEPVSVGNLRTAAKQIRARERLSLL